MNKIVLTAVLVAQISIFAAQSLPVFEESGLVYIHVVDLTLAPVLDGQIIVRRGDKRIAAGRAPTLVVENVAFGSIEIEVAARGFQTAVVSTAHVQSRTAVPVLLQIGMMSGNTMPLTWVEGAWPSSEKGTSKNRWLRFVSLFDGNVVSVFPDKNGAFNAKFVKSGRYLIIAIEEGKVCWQAERTISLATDPVHFPVGCGMSKRQ